MGKPTFTLKGEGRYVRIVQKDKVSNKFQLTLIVDADDAAEVIDTIKEVTEDGRVALRLRNGWKPTLTDAKGKTIKGDPKIGDGSTLKVRFTIEAGGFGDATKKRSVLLIPRAVMLINLIPYTGGGWGDDDIEDGYESDGSEDEIEDAEEEEDGAEEAEEADEPPPQTKPRKKVNF